MTGCGFWTRRVAVFLAFLVIGGIPAFSQLESVVPDSAIEATAPPSLGELSAGAQSSEEVYGAQEILEAMKFQVSQTGYVDPYYTLGPEDTIIINLWGKKTQTFTSLVDPDGFVTLQMDDATARFSVSGIQFKDLRVKILRELSKLTSDIKPDQPESGPIFVDVALGKIRGITFSVLGEVNKPGQYGVKATVGSIFNAISMAGGISDEGSLRQILLRRQGGQQTDEVDLYGFDLYKVLTSAEVDENLFHLRDGDIVVVPLRQGVVRIDGEVRRPGNYEISEGETLASFVELAQGFSPNADPEKIKLFRVKSPNDSQFIGLDFSAPEAESFPLVDGDIVEVVPKAINRRPNFVELTGEGVRQAGKYEYQTGMTMKGLMTLSGGVYDDALLESIVLVRTREDYSLEYETLDLTDLQNRSKDYDLKPLDKVIIFSRFAKEGGDKFVEMRGHVKEPGLYPLSHQMTLYDIIFMAGGFTDPDYLKETYVSRADLIRKIEDGAEVNIPFNLEKVLTGDASENHLLQSGDVIQVYSVEEIAGRQTVSLMGHVKKPGKYPLRQGMRINDLLFQAGGFSDPEFLHTTWFDRADLVRLDPVTLQKRIIAINLRKVLEGDTEADIPLQTGDELRIYAFADFNPGTTVSITGEVNKPGDYPASQDMTLLDLISLANGLTGAADPDQIEIVRFPRPGQFASEAAVVTVVSLRSLSREEESVFLSGAEQVIVRRRPELRNRISVKVAGQVAYPGEYVMLSRTETLSDVIARAGGFIEGAAPEAAKLLRRGAFVPSSALKETLANEAALQGAEIASTRNAANAGAIEGQSVIPVESGLREVTVDLLRALQEPHGPFDLSLLDGDEIHVPRQNWTVSVTGEVLFPRTVQYVAGESPAYYIKMVGGYTSRARKGDTVIVYPNGEAKDARRFFFMSADVKPGSTIIVPGKGDVSGSGMGMTPALPSQAPGGAIMRSGEPLPRVTAEPEATATPETQDTAPEGADADTQQEVITQEAGPASPPGTTLERQGIDKAGEGTAGSAAPPSQGSAIPSREDLLPRMEGSNNRDGRQISEPAGEGAGGNFPAGSRRAVNN